MTPARRKQLTLDETSVMTEAEMAAGYHWCSGWDYLLVGPSDLEWGDDIKQCQCGFKRTLPPLRIYKP